MFVHSDNVKITDGFESIFVHLFCCSVTRHPSIAWFRCT